MQDSSVSVHKKPSFTSLIYTIKNCLPVKKKEWLTSMETVLSLVTGNVENFAWGLCCFSYLTSIKIVSILQCGYAL